MNKQTFISTLERSLTQLPQLEKEHVLHYYLETIEDHIEDGMSEEEAIHCLGTIEDIVQQIISEREPMLEEKAKPKTKRILKWIALIIFSPFLITLFLFAFILYLTLWLLITVLACLVLSFILTSIIGVWYVIPMMIENNASGFIILGCTLFSIGMVPVCIKGVRLSSTWLYRHTAIWTTNIYHNIRKAVL